MSRNNAGGVGATRRVAPTRSFALNDEICSLKQRLLHRTLKSVNSPAGPHILIAGREFINFSSNNYLGLASEPSVIRAAQDALQVWGVGSGASRLISGDLGIHEDLELRIAQLKNEEAALIYSSGYLANLGTLTALLSEKDLVLLDRLDHASLVDAARLSKAKLWVYPHNDLAALEKLLKKGSNYRRRLIATDAYFSMDGDLAPVGDLLELAERYDAWLMIDEAHSTGVFGREGRGLTEHFGVAGKVDIVMGTLSKAIGCSGGFVAGSAVLRETLVNRSREFIYTTAPSPAVSGAAIRAIHIILSEPARRTRLWNIVERVRGSLAASGFDLMGSVGPIIPIFIKDTRKTLAFQEHLMKEGIFAPAIRPPTVPVGTDRLRLSLIATHSEDDIARLLDAMKKAGKAVHA